MIIVDDYGHHPAEIQATLSTAKEVWPNRRLVVVFQPHRFSRTKQFLKQFPKALLEADCIILAPVFAAVAQLLCGMPDASNSDIAAISENIVTKKSGAVKDESWAASKKSCLTDIAGFLRALLAYKECIEANEPPEANFKHIKKRRKRFLARADREL